MRRHTEILRENSAPQQDVLNPFFHRLHLSTLDVIKIAIMSVTLAPLRLVLAGFLLLMVWPLAAIGIAFRSPEDEYKPLTGWRCWLRPLIVFLCRGVFFMGGFSWITVRGVRVSSKEAPILAVAPHSSFFDSLALVYMDLTSVVAKEESKNIPIFGSIIQYSQPVLVSREDPNSRLTTIKEIQRRSHSGGQWPQIFIFPEGTCSNRSCLISFKGGAFIPGVPVQPVCLRYHNKLDTVTWTWDGPGAFQCLWFTLCQFENHLEIEFLPVYHPSQEEIKDPKLFAFNVRQVMAECLHVPVSDHTYDDCRLIEKAEKLHVPIGTDIIEFKKLHKNLGITFDQMQELLDKFRTVDCSRIGQINLQQFASYLHLKESPALQEVFSFYDRDKSGTIDFREYVIGLSLVSDPTNTEHILQYAFQLFDKDNKGYITHEELQIILRNTFALEEEKASSFFSCVDDDKDGIITYDDFRSCAEERPECAKQLVMVHNMKATLNGHAVSGEGDRQHGNGHPFRSSSIDNDIWKTSDKSKSQ